MLRLTRGHPYLTQCLCYSVIQELNRARRREVTRETVEAAANAFVRLVNGYLVESWQELSREARLLLAATAELSTDGREWIEESEVLACLDKHGVALTPRERLQAAQALEDLDWFAAHAEGRAWHYWSRLGLVTRWVREHHPLARTVREVEP
jgi:hypothetical protein